jgi:hypothetical protein
MGRAEWFEIAWSENLVAILRVLFKGMCPAIDQEVIGISLLGGKAGGNGERYRGNQQESSVFHNGLDLG